MSSSKSHVVAGLNDYHFVASLHIQHASISPEQVTFALAIDPGSVKRRGEQRKTPDGKPLSGMYAENHWGADISIIHGHDVSEFLKDFVDRQKSSTIDLMRQIDDTGGSVSIFIGLFAKRCCDFEIPAATLRKLGNAGITVRLNYCGYDDMHDQITEVPSDEREAAAASELNSGSHAPPSGSQLQQG